MAFIGDVTTNERTQPILARYAPGYILGQLFGQAAGGILGDLIGCRSIFFVLVAMFGVAAVGLVLELLADPQLRGHGQTAKTTRGFIADYIVVLPNPFARLILIIGVLEAALARGAFAYIGADLRARFQLSFTLIGITVACFGIGGLLYSALVRHFVYRPGRSV